jgi:signal peptidase I
MARFIETLPGGRQHLILQESFDGPLDDIPTTIVPPGHLAEPCNGLP